MGGATAGRGLTVAELVGAAAAQRSILANERLESVKQDGIRQAGGLQQGNHGHFLQSHIVRLSVNTSQETQEVCV